MIPNSFLVNESRFGSSGWNPSELERGFSVFEQNYVYQVGKRGIAGTSGFEKEVKGKK